jgi:allophanate hydrolase subunit 2
VPGLEMISEPVRIGSIQIPGGGQPIVTMRDGPTVGGYPKLGMIDPRDLSWLTQCRPGQKVRFRELDSEIGIVPEDRGD